MNSLAVPWPRHVGGVFNWHTYMHARRIYHIQCAVLVRGVALLTGRSVALQNTMPFFSSNLSNRLKIRHCAPAATNTVLNLYKSRYTSSLSIVRG